MRTVRNDHSCTPKVATGHMILTDDHQTRKLSMRSSKRIEGKLSHSCDCRKGMSQLLIYAKNALNRLGRLQRVDAGKRRHGRDLLVDLGIVFHGAASERIESRIHTEVHLRKVGVMTHHVKLAYLRQRGYISTLQA